MAKPAMKKLILIISQGNINPEILRSKPNKSNIDPKNVVIHAIKTVRNKMSIRVVVNMILSFHTLNYQLIR